MEVKRIIILPLAPARHVGNKRVPALLTPTVSCVRPIRFSVLPLWDTDYGVMVQRSPRNFADCSVRLGSKPVEPKTVSDRTIHTVGTVPFGFWCCRFQTDNYLFLFQTHIYEN